MSKTKYYSKEEVYLLGEEKPKGKKFLDLEGKVFGDLTVVKFHYKKKCHSSWFCLCKCGKYISSKTNQLNRGRDRCTDCVSKQYSLSKTLGHRQQFYIITVKYPYLRLIDSKDQKDRTKWLWYCPKCVTPFHKAPRTIKQSPNPPCRCNANNFIGWTKQLREFQIKQISKDRALNFLGWKDDYINNKSRFYLKCDKHVHYEINVNNFISDKGYSCPYCAEEAALGRNSHDLAKFLQDAKDVHGDTFDYSNYEYICSRTPSLIKCNVCNKEPFKASYDNHVKKKRGCPHCKGKSQKYCYILLVKDKNTGLPLGLKFGIATRFSNRKESLEKDNTNILLESIGVWEMPSTVSCKDAELEVKRSLTTSYIGRDIMPKGFSETTSVSFLEDIVSVYESHNGILIKEKKE